MASCGSKLAAALIFALIRTVWHYPTHHRIRENRPRDVGPEPHPNFIGFPCGAALGRGPREVEGAGEDGAEVTA